MYGITYQGWFSLGYLNDNVKQHMPQAIRHVRRPEQQGVIWLYYIINLSFIIAHISWLSEVQVVFIETWQRIAASIHQGWDEPIMRVNVKCNEDYVVCTVFWKTEGRAYLFIKIPGYGYCVVDLDTFWLWGKWKRHGSEFRWAYMQTLSQKVPVSHANTTLLRSLQNLSFSMVLVTSFIDERFTR